MNIKEQIARFIAIRRGLCKWECLPEKQDKICGSACKESCYKDADVIQSIYKGAGYYQLQADSEGLVENPYKVQLPASQAEFDAAKQRYEEAKKFYGKEADRGEFDTFREQLIIDNALARAYEEGCKAQKALCDAEKAEAVKKVFSSLRSKMWHSESQYCDREYRITVEDYETILSQMEGE